MTKDRRAVGAVAIMLASFVLFAVAMLARSTPSGATEYPPPAPTTAAQSTCATGDTSGDSTASCGQEAITVHKPSTTPPDSSSSSNLASTGFATATAIAIVVVLFGVGGVCLVAGRRRRHA